MKIIITWGIGEGPNKISAFDRALHDAGIANYNLIKLSSVIPGNSKVFVGKINWNQKEHGYKLYTVLCKHIETKMSKEAWAGLGWIIQNGTGKGLFVEHHGSSKKEVKKLIDDSLKSIREYRLEKYRKIGYKIAGIKCKDKPVCVVVVAVYKSEGWGNKNG